MVRRGPFWSPRPSRRAIAAGRQVSCRAAGPSAGPRRHWLLAIESAGGPRRSRGECCSGSAFCPPCWSSTSAAGQEPPASCKCALRAPRATRIARRRGFSTFSVRRCSRTTMLASRCARECWARITRSPPGCRPILETERRLSVTGTAAYLLYGLAARSRAISRARWAAMRWDGGALRAFAACGTRSFWPIPACRSRMPRMLLLGFPLGFFLLGDFFRHRRIPRGTVPR